MVCRQLGFNGGQALQNLEYGSGSGSIHLDDVQCTGEEVALVDCISADWGVHNCGHVEDAGVICSN